MIWPACWDCAWTSWWRRWCSTTGCIEWLLWGCCLLCPVSFCWSHLQAMIPSNVACFFCYLQGSVRAALFVGCWEAFGHFLLVFLPLTWKALVLVNRLFYSTRWKDSLYDLIGMLSLRILLLCKYLCLSQSWIRVSTTVIKVYLL